MSLSSVLYFPDFEKNNIRLPQRMTTSYIKPLFLIDGLDTKAMCQLNHDVLCFEEMTAAEIEGFWRGYGRYDRSELRSGRPWLKTHIALFG